MEFNIITLFPEIVDFYCSTSIIGRARKNNIMAVNTINPREFTNDKHRTVDDTPYGGGAGMVLMCDPFFKSVKSIERKQNSELIILTPSGETFNQKMAQEFKGKEQINFICGHYEGFDQRIIDGLQPRAISIGDFILTGGELGSLCIIDAVTRLLTGSLGAEESTIEESFSDDLLEYPHYTRPAEYIGMRVPEVLLSGHHANITKWRKKQSILATIKKRTDLFEKFKQKQLTKQEKEILKEIEETRGEE